LVQGWKKFGVFSKKNRSKFDSFATSIWIPLQRADFRVETGK
jgi:hypothetical protein